MESHIQTRLIECYSELLNFTRQHDQDIINTIQTIESGIRNIINYTADSSEHNTRAQQFSQTAQNIHTRDPTTPSTPIRNTQQSRLSRQPSRTRLYSRYFNRNDTNVQLSRSSQPLNFQRTPLPTPLVEPQLSNTSLLTPTNLMNHINNQYNRDFDLFYPIRTRVSNPSHGTTTTIPNNFMDNFMNPVVVRPSLQQINNGSRVLSFSSIENPPNNICAITRETFNPTDMVRQLTACGHIFNDVSIQQWFERSVYCPMCRHDIRSHNSS